MMVEIFCAKCVKPPLHPARGRGITHTVNHLPVEVATMPRQSETSKASGKELINQTQDIWQDYRDKIPQQQRHELGQVLTELGARITYTVQGSEPQSRSKYSTLGGAELASHAVKTVQKASSLLPVDASRRLTWVISEMANRVRYVAEGEFQSQHTSGNGEGFDADFEQRQQMTSQSQHEQSVVFA